jgi:hypothetical protein
MKQQADNIADRFADPETRRVLKDAGLNVDDWDDLELATVACTARAMRSGGRIFVPASMEPLVSALVQRQNQTKTAATPLRRR